MKKNTRKVNKQKGITLIALVVTIVILLILAGISINLVIGDNGIVKKASESKYALEQSEVLEQLRLSTYTKLAEDINNEITNLKYLQQNSQLTENHVVIEKDNNQKEAYIVQIDKLQLNLSTGKGNLENGDVYYVIEENGNGTLYYKYDDSNIVDKEIGLVYLNTNVNAESTDTLKIGDYVNYTYDTAEDYELDNRAFYEIQDITQTQNLQWRVLKIYEDGSVDLISATPTDSEVGLGFPHGYNDGVRALNDICAKQYSNSSLGVTARSIKLEDIESYETSVATQTRLNFTSRGNLKYKETVNIIADKHEGTDYPIWLKVPDACYAEKGVAVNSKDINEGVGASDPIYTSIATTEANTTDEVTVTQTYYTIDFTQTNYGEAANLFNTGINEYWIATRNINYVTEANFCLYYGGTKLDSRYMSCTADNKEGGTEYLRPVVHLGPNTIDIAQGKDASGIWHISGT